MKLLKELLETDQTGQVLILPKGLTHDEAYMKLIEITQNVVEVTYANDQAEDLFNNGEHVADFLDELPADAQLKYLVSSKSGYRAGIVEQEVYVTPDDKVIAREVLSGGNDDIYFLLKMSAKMLPRLFVRA